MEEDKVRNRIALGIEKEFEGDAPLWFDIEYFHRFNRYIKENFDIKDGKPMKILVKAFNDKEWEELEGNS